MEPTPGEQLAPPTSSAPRHNLPVPPSLLIGRESELAELRQLLAAPECRLLTLLGPGGVGKTRLALQAGLEHTGAFRDGVYFVALAPVNAPGMIVPAIADAPNLAFFGPTEPKEQLLNYLREKQLLLILDNLEQLLAGAGLLGDILMWAPQVKLLVTSRERLKMQQEWVYELQGLICPTAEQTDSLEGYSAVALFLRCARRARTAFALTEAEQPYVSQICQLVEGMPLGIELAASWVRVLSCGEIAQEIRRSIDFLSTSLRDVPERHHSLRAVCDQSWSLLSNEERGVLRKLAVFRGGCGREAAETVAGASLRLLAALVDKSLLRRTSGGRYEMHELIRQYAAAQLQANPPEESMTRERFIQYYAAWLERLKDQLLSSKQPETLAEMSAEIDNLRLAWGWMAVHRQLAQIRQSLYSLALFHEISNRFREGEALFRQAAEAFQISGEAATDTEYSVVLAQVLTQQARFYLRLVQIEQARALLQPSLNLIRPEVDQAALADTFSCLGLADLLQGNFPGARHYLEESRTLHRALGNQWEAAICLTLLGYTCQVQGTYEEAYQLLSDSLIELRVIGAPHGTAFCLQTLSTMTIILGKYTEAQRLLDESLELCRAINDRWGLAATLTSSGLMALALGQALRAEHLFRE